MKNNMILLITFIVALCSIVYEVLFSNSLSIVFGNTVVRYSITIGLFLFFMGLGSMSYTYLNKRINDKFLFNIIELFLFLSGISSLLIIYLADIYISRYISLYVVYIPLTFIGFLSGLEIPILSSLLKTNNWSKILGIDYFGSLAGTILFSLYLLPDFGTINTILITSSLNLLALIIFNYTFNYNKYINIIYIIILTVFSYYSITGNFSKKFNEFYIKEKISQQFLVDKKKINVIASFDTEYQNVRYFNVGKEKCLMLDGNLQFCSSWVNVYHQNLFEIPLKFFKKDKKLNILVLGGGDLIGLKHLLFHKEQINIIDLVDLDKKFLKWTKKNLKEFNKNSYKDEKVHIHNEDVYKFLSETNKKYDIVIYDLTALLSDKQLYINSKEFFSFLTNAMKEDGIFIKYSNGEMGFKLEDCENTTIKEREVLKYKDDLIKHIFLNTYKKAGFNYVKYVDGFSVFDNISDDYFNEDYLILAKNNNKRKLILDKNEKDKFKYYKYIDQKWTEIKYDNRVKENSIIYPNYKLIEYRY